MVKQINPHPMVAKVAHLPKIQQAKAVKAQVKMAHPHKDKVDKAMAILKVVKVKVIPIVVRVKVMVAKVKGMATEMGMAIPTLKAKAIPKAEMKATHPKVVMVAKKALKKEIPIVKTEMVAIPTPIMRVEIPPIPIQIGKQPIQILTKMVKKANKVEILPKRVIPMVTRLQQMAIPKAEIRAMKAVIPIVPASLPKMKMPSNNVLKKPKMVGTRQKKPCRMQIVKRHRMASADCGRVAG